MDILNTDILNTIIKVTAIFFALLGGFVMHYLLSRNETIIERLGLDYHCLRSTLHLFNYKPLYENPDKSKKILAPILDYLAYVCQLWYISAVQGSPLRKNVLEASQLFANEEKLKEHFLDTAKKLDESRGEVRVLPSGFFEFVLFILIVLAGTTLVGLWITLIYEPTSFNPLFFAFYAVLSIFFVLFFAYIYDLKRIDAFVVILRPYDFLKWQFIRCLIFADNNGEDGPVKQYLEEAKRAYEDYTNLKYVQEKTRKDLLEKAEEVAKQFLKKRQGMAEDELWEKEVEGTVPWAAIEALRRRFRGWYTALIVAFSVILICPGCPCVFSCFQSLRLPISGLVLLWIVIAVLLGFLICLFLYLVGERKPLPRLWTRGVEIVSFLENLHKYWNVIIKIEQNYEKEKKQQEKDIQKKREMYNKVKEELKKGIKECRGCPTIQNGKKKKDK